MHISTTDPTGNATILLCRCELKNANIALLPVIFCFLGESISAGNKNCIISFERIQLNNGAVEKTVEKPLKRQNRRFGRILLDVKYNDTFSPLPALFRGVISLRLWIVKKDV
jgi:hypothetical protein